MATLGAASEPRILVEHAAVVHLSRLAARLLVRSQPGYPGALTATVAAPAALAATFLLVLASSASARASYALPLLAPLAALAAPAVVAVPRRAGLGLIALAIVLLLPITVYAWAVWLAAIGAGHVPDWPMLAQYLPMDQVMDIDATSIERAVGLLLGFAWMVRASALAPARPVVVWAGAFLLAWGTLTCLWMPWIDRARSYRSVFADVASHLPAHACLAADGLGESERAMLRYTTGVMPEIVSRHHGPTCNQVLVQGHADDLSPLVPYRAHALVWEGARPGDRRERFWLLSRALSVATNDNASRGRE